MQRQQQWKEERVKNRSVTRTTIEQMAVVSDL
jgi:hypothetical protein